MSSDYGTDLERAHLDVFESVVGSEDKVVISELFQFLKSYSTEYSVESVLSSFDSDIEMGIKTINLIGPKYEELGRESVVNTLFIVRSYSNPFNNADDKELILAFIGFIGMSIDLVSRSSCSFGYSDISSFINGSMALFGVTPNRLRLAGIEGLIESYQAGRLTNNGMEEGDALDGKQLDERAFPTDNLDYLSDIEVEKISLHHDNWQSDEIPSKAIMDNFLVNSIEYAKETKLNTKSSVSDVLLKIMDFIGPHVKEIGADGLRQLVAVGSGFDKLGNNDKLAFLATVGYVIVSFAVPEKFLHKSGYADVKRVVSRVTTLTALIINQSDFSKAQEFIDLYGGGSVESFGKLSIF